jgi:hypothetical protein
MTLMIEKHMTVAIMVALLAGAALVNVISLRVSDAPTAIPPTLTPATIAPALPVQRGAVPLQPEPMAAPNQPKAHAATSTSRKRSTTVTGDDDWMTGQPQWQMASNICGNFGIC